jgi:hypothetical protein
MYTLHDQLGDKDLSKTRTFELENGNKLIAVQSDPYGFWRLHLAQGQLPGWLDQDFNEWGQVEKAVERYKIQRDEAVAAIAEKEANARPKVQVKPGFNRDGSRTNGVDTKKED